ncbi:hypothetical protein [Kitasatospora sp. NPDC058478]|uniref:hypothetical protein n=1 Tax=unclassified Kitasatospora TaxID=2633591 RepID=UPI003662C5AF
MTFARLPAHDRVNDPAWQARYADFEPLIAALRRRGFVADIGQIDGAETILAQLPDGTFLRIDAGGDSGGLPDDIDSAESWRAIRDSADNPTVRDGVYDSTVDGPDFLQGALLSPLIVAIDTYLEARGIALLTIPHAHSAVVTVVTVHDHGPASYVASEVFPDAADAARHVQDVAAELSATPGITQCHTSRTWPRYVLAGRDHTRIVQATLAELTPERHSPHGRCTCLFAHPQTPRQEQQLGQQIENALKTGDAPGVYLAALRLFTAPQCPARKANPHG